MMKGEEGRSTKMDEKRGDDEIGTRSRRRSGIEGESRKKGEMKDEFGNMNGFLDELDEKRKRMGDERWMSVSAAWAATAGEEGL
jgi:hypothetical protein